MDNYYNTRNIILPKFETLKKCRSKVIYKIECTIFGETRYFEYLTPKGPKSLQGTPRIWGKLVRPQFLT